jgi:hypothetical protein
LPYSILASPSATWLFIFESKLERKLFQIKHGLSVKAKWKENLY